MHPALEIPELSYLIFRNLLGDSSHSRLDLLSCCLTCRAFSEPALDLIWKDLPSVTVMPFASPSQYETVLNPDDHEYDGTAFSNHLERLKFYGRRVRVMWVHSKLTPQLLKCIVNLTSNSPSALSPLTCLMSTVFPSLTRLNVVLPVSPSFENLYDLQIRAFFVPTVKALALYCGASARYDHLTAALRSVRAVQPSLTSLTLGPEIISEFNDPPPTTLDDELSSLIHALPRLKKFQLPPYLITHPVLTAIVRMPALEQLALFHPPYIQWKRSVPAGNTLPVVRESSEDSPSCLFSLEIKSTFDFIPHALYMHPSLTSYISRLSLSCLPPGPRITLKSFFSPTLSSAALGSLTHLSLDFASPTFSVLQPHGLDADFFAPLFATPFISHLVSFHVRHNAPLDMAEQDFDAMARSMPKLESLCLVVIPFMAPRRVRIPASIAALASFTTHCPRLREITLPVNAETLIIPEAEHFRALAGVHSVAVDMSVSLVGDDVVAVAKVLAKLFPNRRAQLTSYWADHLRHLQATLKDCSEEGLSGYRATYARRWRTIGKLLHQS
ncbi:hypothetical protein LshimejAT787_1900970 [Lyophyllum shimeji]|uniref:F-box domain-containing protein n=1 Tax=Lyophyllum shimeji TaxID=47721 RepID=A0A9P3Q0P0_LYOSH|nr:hypothetical protein LshimejAT787_1900970 [Lyophyllum shimeji]